MKDEISSYFRQMDKIQETRIEKSKTNRDSRLNQGTSWWWPPYTLSETWEYLKGFISAGATSKENPDAYLGKKDPSHVVGLKKAEIEHTAKAMNHPEDFLVFGDVLLSKNGKKIELGDALKKRIREAKVIVLNIESPVTSDKLDRGYSRIKNIVLNGFKFSLYIPDGYLKALIQDIKHENPNIEIIYDVANNHTLDANQLPYEEMTAIEQSLYDFDKLNFPLYRTIYAIRQIDPNAKIIGAWTHELEFKSFPIKGNAPVNLQTEPVAITTLNGLNIGFMALTDILNNNFALWEKGRVMRPEDVKDWLDKIKNHYHLDQFYILIHGGLEQNLYPSLHWQQLLRQLAAHCDGIIGHGSHLPGLSQVVNTQRGFSFIETSLGNFFCPTNPRNTAISTMLTGKVTEKSIQYIEEPIEAIQENGHPKVEVLSEKANNMMLLHRWFKMHPQEFSTFSQKTEKLEEEELVSKTTL